MVQPDTSTDLTAAASVNGVSAVEAAAAPQPDAIEHSGPRIPRRLVWVDVPEYDGFRAKVWCNYPKRLALELASEDQERIYAALGQLVLEHNGWLDDQGEPFPPADTRAFWDAVPNELALMLMRVATVDAASLLPNSFSARPTRRR
jgi:hypothetical protein